MISILPEHDIAGWAVTVQQVHEIDMDFMLMFTTARLPFLLCNLCLYVQALSTEHLLHATRRLAWSAEETVSMSLLLTIGRKRHQVDSI